MPNDFPSIPNSKIHGANVGPTWGRQEPGGPHSWSHEPCYVGLYSSFCQHEVKASWEQILKVTWHTAVHVPINIFANVMCQRLINKSVLISRLPPCCRSLQSYADINASLIDCDQNCWIFLGKRWWLVQTQPIQTALFHEILNFIYSIVEICFQKQLYG